MRGSLLFIALLAAALVIVAPAALSAGPYGARAEAHDSVTVSGIWSSVQWYESDGCYSGVGEPTVSDWKSRAQNNTPVDLSTIASDANGAASSVIKVNAPGLMPTIAIHSTAGVQDLMLTAAHWASAFSEGGANWLTSGATQSVTVKIDYKYNLDLTEAHPCEPFPYAFAKIYVAFWDPGGNLMLSAKDGFEAEGNYLVKEVRIDEHIATGEVSGYTTWDISVTNGSFYSFWSMTSAEVWTAFDETPTKASSWGSIKELFE
jgi:hypothetical protein